MDTKRLSCVHFSALFVLILGVCGACSMMEVNHRYDPNQDFTTYRTFAWVSSEVGIKGAFDLDSERLDEIIRSSIEGRLMDKGFLKTDAQTADFLVNYQAVVQTKIEGQTHPQWLDFDQVYRGTNYGYSSSSFANTVTTIKYEAGTLVVDILDNKQDLLVWRGVLETPVGIYEKQEKQLERVNRAITKVLTAFPPKK